MVNQQQNKDNLPRHVYIFTSSLSALFVPSYSSLSKKKVRNQPFPHCSHSLFLSVPFYRDAASESSKHRWQDLKQIVRII
jgi:hypothetical protein